MKEISLSQGKFALVDDEDFEYLNQFKWCVMKVRNLFYACRMTPKVDGKQTKIKMHCEIMGGKWIDHIKGNGLDNQRSNLRFATKSENSMNRRKRENTSSKFKGVNWNKQSGKWRAIITINGKRINLGLFILEKDAAKAYNKKAIELFGEFAKLNVFEQDNTEIINENFKEKGLHNS